MSLLDSLGWNSFFEEQFRALKETQWIPARVIGEEKNLFRLQLPNGKAVWGELTGKFHYSAENRLMLPATGDWVACTPLENTDRAVIRHLFERKTCLKRKVAGTQQEDQILAANVDTVFIATSLNMEFNPRRLERYLALVWESGAQPVILLTKSDLAENAAEFVEQVEGVALGVNVHVISTVAKEGLEQLAAYLKPSQTVVLLGSSGVGKSTLVNQLLGRETIKTQSISAEKDKGRHTTTARYLFQMESGAMLIDTPGMREIQFSDHDDGISAVFEDIELLAASCKFTNCQHQTEPECGILGALESGELSQERWESYLKLQRELDFHKRKTDKTAAAEEKNKWKKIHKNYRKVMKEKKH